MLETETALTEKLSLIPVELPVEWDDLKGFRDTEVIVSIKPPAKSKSGKSSVNLRLEPPVRRGDISLMNYVCSSLIARNDRLIPFVWNNESAKLLARHYHIHRTSSSKTLNNAALFLNSFCEFTGAEPDSIIHSLCDNNGNSIPKSIKRLKNNIEDWQVELKALDYAPGTIKQGTGCIKAWLEVNEIDVGRLQKPQGYIKYPVRSFRAGEIERLIDVGELQDKVIISILATSGLRAGTLTKLKYGHVREELEAAKTPCSIHIKADETKGKYADFYTFINEEAVDYLNLYLERRKRGTESGKIPPEELDDESPLIKNSRRRQIEGVSYSSIYARIHKLMQKADLIEIGTQKRYELNVHSLRKWFKTQMTAEGVQSDYVEFFMGHVISTYQDVKSLGIEKLREIYRSAGLSIRPRPEISKLDQLKTIAESLGLDPNKIDYREYIGPHRTVIGEEGEIEGLQEAIKESLTELVSEKKDRRR